MRCRGGHEAEGKLNPSGYCDNCKTIYYLKRRNSKINKLDSVLDKCFGYEGAKIKEMTENERVRYAKMARKAELDRYWDINLVKELFGTKRSFQTWFNYYRKDISNVLQLIELRKKQVRGNVNEDKVFGDSRFFKKESGGVPGD